jgi:hypothetical protein
MKELGPALSTDRNVQLFSESLNPRTSKSNARQISPDYHEQREPSFEDDRRRKLSAHSRTTMQTEKLGVTNNCRFFCKLLRGH